jgi:hypothetical protein
MHKKTEYGYNFLNPEMSINHLISHMFFTIMLYFEKESMKMILRDVKLKVIFPIYIFPSCCKVTGNFFVENECEGLKNER